MKTTIAIIGCLLSLQLFGTTHAPYPDCRNSTGGACCITNTVTILTPNGWSTAQAWSCSVPCPQLELKPLPNPPAPLVVNTNPPVATGCQSSGCSSIQMFLVGGQGWEDPEGFPVVVQFSLTFTNYIVSDGTNAFIVQSSDSPVGPWINESCSSLCWVSQAMTPVDNILSPTSDGSLASSRKVKNLYQIIYDSTGCAFATNFYALSQPVVGYDFYNTPITDGRIIATLKSSNPLTTGLPLPIHADRARQFFRYKKL